MKFFTHQWNPYTNSYDSWQFDADSLSDAERQTGVKNSPTERFVTTDPNFVPPAREVVTKQIIANKLMDAYVRNIHLVEENNDAIIKNGAEAIGNFEEKILHLSDELYVRHEGYADTASEVKVVVDKMIMEVGRYSSKTGLNLFKQACVYAPGYIGDINLETGEFV